MTDDIRVIAAGETDDADLFENAPCGYISTTMDGLIVRANETFLGWTGFSRDDLVGRRHFHELLTPGARIYHETHYAPLLQMQGEVSEIALDIVTADGSHLPALINSVVRERGGTRYIRTAIFDASHRRQYERELLLATKRAEDAEARLRILADTLQASLIPPTPPHIPGLDVGAAFYAAAAGAEVGGDFYDVFEIGPDDWVALLGDVQGKGVKAATVTALARYTLRAGAIQARQPSLVLNLLNAAMLRQQPDSFCTVAYARVRRSEGGHADVTITSGGHPLPLFVPSVGEPQNVGLPGTVIGVVPDPELHDHDIRLEEGDVLVFFTDGVPEARNEDGFYGEDRMSALVAANRSEDATTIAKLVVDDVLAFQRNRPRDDVAVLALKVGEPPAAANA